MIRIGLTQRVQDVVDYGERRDCLDQNWARLLCELGLLPVPLCNVVDDVPDYVAALALDSVILTGGNDLAGLPGERNVAHERDRFENALIDCCLARSIPMLGVCRGMQMINRFFQGSISRVPGHAATRHRVFSRPAAFPFWEDSFEVNSYHDYAIEKGGLAKPLEALATGTDATVESFRHRERPCYGIMWHPERERPADRRDIAMLRAVFGSEAK